MRRVEVVLGAAFVVAAAACGGGDPVAGARATRLEVRELNPERGTLALPVRDGSVRFAVIGDAGRGDRAQVEVAQQMAIWHERFPFEFVLMLGDNIYPPHTADDYLAKFERPYSALLSRGVQFRAAIGNHDPPATVYYRGFNMEGQRYYTFRGSERGLRTLTGASVRFFAIDSRTLDRAQLDWLTRALAESGSDWKICFLHHPLYTSGRYRGSARALRIALEPLLVSGDVDVVLSGHEHFYERLRPQQGIAYFISGAAGSLRRGDIRPSPFTARGFDTDYHFLLFEAAGPRLYFQAISRSGATIDAGVIEKRPQKAAGSAPR